MSDQFETEGTQGDGSDGEPADTRVDSRAELLPEEQAAGSDDAHEQAREILEESDARTADPERTAAESVQTATPDERGDT